MRRTLITLALLASACAPELTSPSCDEGGCDETSVKAICGAKIVGRTTTVDVELTYLPNLLACENASGGFQSLKAQAIAARSYLYYVMLDPKQGAIYDSEWDQVFSCGRQPTLLHKQAVEATSGKVLRYNDTIVAAFYAAGADQSGPSCSGGTTGRNAHTEYRVTYNHGKTGDQVTQSESGWVNKKNYANRGGMSQNGANCLADQGYTYQEIIEFYYGDAEIVKASGSCVVPTDDDDDDNTGLRDSWIGTDCTTDQYICDFEVNGQTGDCIDWFDDSDNQEIHGFCSLECEGYCPDKNGEPTSFCADLDDTGFGACVIAPDTSNDFCGDIRGTVAQVVQRFVGNSGAPAVYQGVCSPPTTSPISCSGGAGECIDTNSMTCGGQTQTGLCPGGSNIVCCLD